MSIRKEGTEKEKVDDNDRTSADQQQNEGAKRLYLEAMHFALCTYQRLSGRRTPPRGRMPIPPPSALHDMQLL